MVCHEADYMYQEVCRLCLSLCPTLNRRPITYGIDPLAFVCVLCEYKLLRCDATVIYSRLTYLSMDYTAAGRSIFTREMPAVEVG